MKARVYLETTVVSYLTARPTRKAIAAAHQQISKLWWDRRRQDFDLVVSELVLKEAGAGDPDAAKRRPRLLEDVPILSTPDAVAPLVRALIQGHALPTEALQDAFHIAICALHGVPFLLTWNCTHIANAEQLPIIRRVLESQGLTPPVICTPEELMGDANEH